ncbi:MAG: DUF1684 domain-containing protein [Actinomycetota bacterium]
MRPPTEQYLQLAEWRREIAQLYASVRAAASPLSAWEVWRAKRDEMFLSHPQSPLSDEARAAFGGSDYFAYDDSVRVLGKVEDAPLERHSVPTSSGEPMELERFARLRFKLYGQELTLDAYWLTGYGGGIFVPFRDRTSGVTTYGAGRYLWDSIKGADLGATQDALLLDFNFAYNPSCSYDDRWACPLAPPANHLPVEVRAGEKTLKL